MCFRSQPLGYLSLGTESCEAVKIKHADNAKITFQNILYFFPDNISENHDNWFNSVQQNQQSQTVLCFCISV